MFKKLILTLLLTLLLATGAMVGPAFAGQMNATIIQLTTLTNTTNSTSSGPIYVQDFKKVAFIVYNDETGSSINTTMTMTGSYNGTTWLTQSFYDLASATTLVTSEIFAADTNYFCWLDPISTMPIMNMTITTDATKTGNSTNVSAYIMGEK